MKKRIIALLLSISAIFLVSFGSPQEEVVFFNWGGTIDEAVLDKFEKETNIKVTYAEFDENEKMYTLVKSDMDLYDVIVPSEYMLEKMAAEGLVEELDHSKLPNMKYINDVFLNKEFDPGNKYSLPMYFGTLGILYNKNKVAPEDLNGWNAIFNEKYKGQIWMLDSSRDTMGPGFWHLGYSSNARDPKQLKEVKELMQKQKSLVKAYVADELISHMVNGNGAMAVTYSAKANDAIKQNPKELAYYLPQHSNVWMDNYAIVKNATNKENAYKLINFLCDPKNAAMSGYIQAVPIEDAKKIEPTKEASKDKVLYPPITVLTEQETYKDLGPFVNDFEQAWEDVKNY